MTGGCASERASEALQKHTAYTRSGPRPIWRGVVSKTPDPKAKLEKREQNLNKALTKLFKQYPPQVKS